MICVCTSSISSRGKISPTQTTSGRLAMVSRAPARTVIRMFSKARIGDQPAITSVARPAITLCEAALPGWAYIWTTTGTSSSGSASVRIRCSMEAPSL